MKKNNIKDVNFITKLQDLIFYAPNKHMKKRLTSFYKFYIFKSLSKKEKAIIILKNILMILVLLVLLAAFYFAITLLIGFILL